MGNYIPLAKEGLSVFYKSWRQNIKEVRKEKSLFNCPVFIFICCVTGKMLNINLKNKNKNLDFGSRVKIQVVQLAYMLSVMSLPNT